MADLEVTAAPIPGIPRSVEIRIEGAADVMHAKELQEGLARAIDPNALYVCIVMSPVSYFGRAGMQSLTDTAAALEKQGGAMVLVDLQPKIKLMFQNLGMEKLFRLEKAVEGARAFLKTRAGGP